MKAHLSIDPDSEIITATTVTPGNAGDAVVAEELISDLLDDANADTTGENNGTTTDDPGDLQDGDEKTPATTVYGDNAYGTGPFQRRLEDEGIDSRCKTQKPNATNGLFSKELFTVDLEDDTVTCPAGVTVSIRRHTDSGGIAKFAEDCASCALRAQCTKAKEGRSITVGADEAVLARARARQKHSDWIADYRATRPKVERKIAHLMRRKHGGRRARVRGRDRVAADFKLLAAVVNLARLGTLGACSTHTGWSMAGA
ncbi:MAG: transposase [Acidimicrobiales bacterium]